MSGVLPATEEVTEGKGNMWVGEWSIPEQHVSLLPFHLPGTKLTSTDASEVHLVVPGIEDARGMGVL